MVVRPHVCMAIKTQGDTIFKRVASPGGTFNDVMQFYFQSYKFVANATAPRARN